MATIDAGPVSVRHVTDDEVASYRRDGWVLLPGLLGPGVADELLERIEGRMGSHAEASMRGDYATVGVTTTLQSAWRNYDFPSQDDEWIKSLCFSEGITALSTRLAGGDVRFLADQVLCKLPASESGTKTPWHNDSSYFPFDRAGAMTIWIAMVECPPEKGTLRFLGGSHRERLLGRYAHRTDGVDIVDANPWLVKTYELSAPLHLRAGDATVHDHQTIHMAPANETDSPRWVYTTHRFPADALYTGCPQRFTNDLGLVVNEVLDHPNFPRLAAT